MKKKGKNIFTDKIIDMSIVSQYIEGLNDLIKDGENVSEWFQTNMKDKDKEFLNLFFEAYKLLLTQYIKEEDIEKVKKLINLNSEDKETHIQEFIAFAAAIANNNSDKNGINKEQLNTILIEKFNDLGIEASTQETFGMVAQLLGEEGASY